MLADLHWRYGHLLGIGPLTRENLSSKCYGYRLFLAGFEEVIPDISLLVPVHFDAYIAQLVLWNAE